MSLPNVRTQIPYNITWGEENQINNFAKKLDMKISIITKYKYKYYIITKIN